MIGERWLREDDMAVTGHIYDPRDGTCLARIMDDTGVFDATLDGRQIGTIRDGEVYDLKGGLVGHLQPHGMFDDDAASEALRELVRRTDDS
jgi:hypothetical protein